MGVPDGAWNEQKVAASRVQTLSSQLRVAGPGAQQVMDVDVDTKQHPPAKPRGSICEPDPSFPATVTSGALSFDIAGWDPVRVGSIYSRVFALGYDSFLAWGERAGMQALRQNALAEATGWVIEIGAGTGLNAPLFPLDVERITLSEPDSAMRHRLGQRVASLGGRYEILDAPADNLPVESGVVDTVVSTLVLCTVADLAATLTEIRRVLAPGGRLILIEHVRAAGPRLRGWQNRLHGPWMAFAEGCHCNRDIVTALGDAGFDPAQLQQARWRRMPPIVSPLVVGSATPQPPGWSSTRRTSGRCDRGARRARL